MTSKAIISRLLSENRALVAENAALRSANTALEARLAELERRFGLNSTNSSRPPSSDGLSKASAGKQKKQRRRTGSLREKSGSKPGGQNGHKGCTLRQIADPDATVDHFPEACRHCGSALTPDMATGYGARQVFDLPEPRPLIVTEHRAQCCRCANCGHETRSPFPQEVRAPVQYGTRITATVVYLSHGQFLPEDRLSALMADLFGATLVPATIARMSQGGAARFRELANGICARIKAAAVKHLDETGFRVGGKTQWLPPCLMTKAHCVRTVFASTALLTSYRVSARRGSLLTGVGGIIVHDHWKPYYTMQGVLHALCNAHHLRELKALIEIEKEGWAGAMQRLLRRACHAANLARERGSPLKPSLVARIECRFEAIVAEGIAFHEAQPPLDPAARAGKRRGRRKRRIGHNLLLRLQGRKEDVLRFLTNPDVPFTNNQAEQDVRMMKLKQKISGGFRSQQGAEDFAIIRSVISTARKQGRNIIKTLMEPPEVLINRLRTA